jgi:hypothetical protein
MTTIAQAAPLAPVEIHGDRFYSGGAPYFPVTHFLADPAHGLLSHTYFSSKISDAKRAEIYNQIKSSGYNTIYLYTLNQGDYDSKSVTPYANHLVGGAFDEAKIARWHHTMERFIADGVRPVVWLFADDSPAIRNAPTQELKRYTAKMVDAFDDLPVMWVLALEADEYWSKAKADTLGAYLQSLTNQPVIAPVGIHQLPGKTDYMTSPWVDFGVYQDGFSNSPTELFDRIKERKATLDNKPLLAAEYEKGDSLEAQRKGLAAAFAGAAGVGNGGPPGLAAFMQSLPDGMTPSRSGNILMLKGSGVTAIANLATLEFMKMGPGVGVPEPDKFTIFGPGRSPCSGVPVDCVILPVLLCQLQFKNYY